MLATQGKHIEKHVHGARVLAKRTFQKNQKKNKGSGTCLLAKAFPIRSQGVPKAFALGTNWERLSEQQCSRAFVFFSFFLKSVFCQHASTMHVFFYVFPLRSEHQCVFLCVPGS